MNFRSFLTLLVLIVSASTAWAEDAKKTADDFAAKWVAAYDAGDAGALAGMFTQDGVFNAPSGAVVKGREGIEKALAGRMKAGWTKETVMTTDAGAAGSAVWRGRIRFAGLRRSGRQTDRRTVRLGAWPRR